METKLGELVLRKNLINKDQLREALLIQRSGSQEIDIKKGEKLGRILLRKEYVDPMELVRVLCEQKSKIDFLLIDKYFVEPRVITWIPENIAINFKILPLISLGDEEIIVARSSPSTKDSLITLEKKLKRAIEVIIVKEKNMSDVISHCYKTFKRRGLSSVKIGEILVRDKFITQKELEIALKESVETQRMLGKILIEKGKVNERDFFNILGLQKGIPLASANDIIPILNEEVAKSLSMVFSLRNLVLPYLKEEINKKEDKVYVVTSEPSINPEDIRIALSCKEIDLKLMTYTDIESIFRFLYTDNEEDAEEGELKRDNFIDVPIEEDLVPVSIGDVETVNKKSKKFSSNLLKEAINKNASDIHIENYEKKAIIRFRLDGTLYDIPYLQVNSKNINGIINVLKVWSNLDIAERRLPQGGRFRKKTKDGNIYDFRIQTQPTLHGENIIIRILNQTSSLLGLDELGFSADVRPKYERIIKNPSGLILIAGPTGSGKTTTLYSTLDILKKDLSKKIVTIEDPIEYSLERIQQSQVKEEIGYNFAMATRSFLREDPDIMLIGEIRDYETAIEAMRSSQTGHLVFSTLHTNNTIESIQRLIDMGLDPSTISSELLVVMSQRLAKRICPDCKKLYKPSKELLGVFYPKGVPSGMIFYKGVGCELCGFRGHKGRIAVVEFWFVDSESKSLILTRANPSAILSNAIKGGMVSMVEDALMKVAAGKICLDELPEVIPYYQISLWTDDERFADSPEYLSNKGMSRIQQIRFEIND